MPERDLLRLEYVPLSQVVLWERNPKQHDIGAIAESIRRHGFKDPLKYEPALNDGQGGIVEGGGRGIALQMMRDQEPSDPPRGIDILKDTGEWAAPVLFGVDAESEAAAEAYGVDHNNLTYAGAPGVNPWDLMRMWDEEGYLSLVQGLAVEDVLPVSVDGDDLDALSIMLRDDWLPDDLDIPDIEGAGGEALRVIIQFADKEEMAEFFEFVGAEQDENKVRYNWADIRKGEE